MNDPDWRNLILTTVTDPAEAARRVLAMNLSRDVLWLALTVAVLLNTILVFGPAVVTGAPVLLPSFLSSPLGYLAVVGLGLLIMIAAIFWIGGAMGGTGRVEDVAAVLIWLQFMRVVVQAAILVLQILFPFFAVLLALAAAFYSIFIVLHFVDQAHDLNSLGRSAAILVAALLAIALVMTLLLALFGGFVGDPSAYV